MAPILLVALIVTTYSVSLFGGFIRDDWTMIVENQDNLRSIAIVPSFFTSGVWAFSSRSYEGTDLYRPMWLVWHFLNYKISGHNPFGWHLASVALHTINAFLVAALIRRLLPETSAAEQYAGAALFGVHPALAETVAWITGSTDIVLSAAFLAGFLSYLRFRESGRNRDFAWTTACFTVAALTKETGFVFPFAVIAYELCKGTSWKDLWSRQIAILLAIAGAYLVVRTLALGGALQGGESGLEITAESLSRLVDYALLYARFLAVPWPLHYYIRHMPDGIVDGYDIALGAVVAAALIYTLFRHRMGRFAVIWMVLTLAGPLLTSLHELGEFAARYLYLPAAGGAVLATIVLLTFRERWHRVLPSAAAGLAVAFAMLTTVETLTWKSEETWLRKIISRDPGATGAWVFLAKNHVRLGDTKKTIEVYREAIETVPLVSDKVVIAEMLGLYYADSGSFQESLEVYEWISRQPGFKAAGLLGAGNNYWMLNRREMALDAYRRALDVDPTNVFAHFNSARLLEHLDRNDEAFEQYKRLLDRTPPGATAEMLEHARRFVSQKGEVVPRLGKPK